MESSFDYRGLLLIFAGLFSIAGAAFDWNFFMGSSKAAIFVKIMGRNGARVFYGLLGCFVGGTGLALTMGWLG